MQDVVLGMLARFCGVDRAVLTEKASEGPHNTLFAYVASADGFKKLLWSLHPTEVRNSDLCLLLALEPAHNSSPHGRAQTATRSRATGRMATRAAGTSRATSPSSTTARARARPAQAQSRGRAWTSRTASCSECTQHSRICCIAAGRAMRLRSCCITLGVPVPLEVAVRSGSPSSSVKSKGPEVYSEVDVDLLGESGSDGGSRDRTCHAQAWHPVV